MPLCVGVFIHWTEFYFLLMHFNSILKASCVDDGFLDGE